MTQPNPVDAKVSTLTPTPVVLANPDDTAALIEWSESTSTRLDVVTVEDWSTPIAPKDMPAGEVHIFAQTRDSRETWDAVRSLCVAMTQAGRTPVLIETTMPLNFLLSGESTWESLTAGSVAKPAGRAPAAGKGRAVHDAKADAVCLTSTGLTVRTTTRFDPSTGAPVEEQETVLGWAAWVTEVAHFDAETLATIEVAFPTEAGPVERVKIPDVSGSELARFDWLERHPYTYPLPRPTDSLRTDVANAIRRATGPQGERTVNSIGSPAMGWQEVDGRAVSVRPDAGLGADGLNAMVHGGDGETSKAYRWGKERTIEEERAALRTVLIDMPALMKTPDAWYAALGQHGRAVAPGTGGVALIYYGTQNNGKTVMGRCAGGLMGRGLLTGGLRNFKATRTALDLIAGEFINGVCFIDDIPPLLDERTASSMRAILDDLLRAAHPEGSLKTRGTVRNGKVGVAHRTDAHPSALITTEESLVALAPLTSTRNRALGVEIVRGREFESAEESDAFEDAAQQAPTAGYALTRWLAGYIDDVGGLDEYGAALIAATKAEAARFRASYPMWDTRTQKMLAGYYIGLDNFASAAVAIGALTEDEKSAFMAAGETALRTLFENFVERWLSDADARRILDEIRVQVNRGKVMLSAQCECGRRSGERCEVHGQLWAIATRKDLDKREIDSVPEGGSFYAFSPEDVAEALRTPSMQRTTEQVRKQLLETTGAVKAKLRFAGKAIWLVLVPVSEYDGSGKKDGEESV